MGAQGAGGGYTSAYPEYLPDARQRGRVSIAHVLPPGKDALARHRGVPADLVFSSILSKSLLALSLHLVKEWLFTDPAVRADLGAIHFKLLALAALASALWNRPWEAFASGNRLRVSVQCDVPLLRVLGQMASLTASLPFASPRTSPSYQTRA